MLHLEEVRVFGGTGQGGIAHHFYLTWDLDVNQQKYFLSCLEREGHPVQKDSSVS